MFIAWVQVIPCGGEGLILRSLTRLEIAFSAGQKPDVDIRILHHYFRFIEICLLSFGYRAIGTAP